MQGLSRGWEYMSNTCLVSKGFRYTAVRVLANTAHEDVHQQHDDDVAQLVVVQHHHHDEQ